MMAGSITVRSELESTFIATENSKMKIPLESARVGTRDDSLADNPVTDPGTNKTTKQIISMALAALTA